MGATDSHYKVLVTGASGFAARYAIYVSSQFSGSLKCSHIVRALLEAGYAVRGTVRTEAKGEALKKVFENHRFEYVVVTDIAAVSADVADMCLLSFRTAHLMLLWKMCKPLYTQLLHSI